MLPDVVTVSWTLPTPYGGVAGPVTNVPAALPEAVNDHRWRLDGRTTTVPLALSEELEEAELPDPEETDEPLPDDTELPEPLETELPDPEETLLELLLASLHPVARSATSAADNTRP